MRRKQQAIHAALVVLTLWPLGHIWLVKRFELSPWKLGGWGMYGAPRLNRLGMEIYGSGPGAGPEQQLTAPEAALRAEAHVFLERHRWLRRLVRPDRLARAVLEVRPEWERIRIVVFRPEVDPATAMVVTRTVDYVYPRQ